MQLEELALRFERELGRLDDALRRIDRLRRSSPRPELWDAREAALLEHAGRRREARAAAERGLARIAAAPARIRALGTTVRLHEELEARLASLDSHGEGKTKE